jgi:hypothetical protein
MTIFKKILRLLKQKSTWAGVGLAVSALGAPAVGVTIGKLGTAVALVAGGTAIGHDEDAVVPAVEAVTAVTDVVEALK